MEDGVRSPTTAAANAGGTTDNAMTLVGPEQRSDQLFQTRRLAISLGLSCLLVAGYFAILRNVGVRFDLPIQAHVGISVSLCAISSIIAGVWRRPRHFGTMVLVTLSFAVIPIGAFLVLVTLACAFWGECL
jgi:hypothetical protein